MVLRVLPLAAASLAVRFGHVLGMALVLGGAVFVWFLLRDATRTDDGQALTAASAYERLFWAAMGLLVMTGVGNLGAFAPSIPGGDWATTLSAKLLLVSVVLLGSLVRSLLVVAARRDGQSVGVDVLRNSYAATVVVLGTVLVLAEVLAHG